MPERIDVFVTSDSTDIIEAIYGNTKFIERMTSADYLDLVRKKPSKIDLTPAIYQRKFNHCAYGYYHFFMLKTLFE